MRRAISTGSTVFCSAAVVSGQSGAALVWSPLVTMALRASTHDAARPREDNAAATMRLLRISPMAAIVSSQRGDHFTQHPKRANHAIERVELLRDVAFYRCALSISGNDACHFKMPCAQRLEVISGAIDVSGAGLGRHTKQSIGRAAQRRHHHDGPAPVGGLRLDRHLPRRANDGHETLDGVAVGDRGATKFRDDHGR